MLKDVCHDESECESESVRMSERVRVTIGRYYNVNSPPQLSAACTKAYAYYYYSLSSYGRMRHTYLYSTGHCDLSIYSYALHFIFSPLTYKQHIKYLFTMPGRCQGCLRPPRHPTPPPPPPPSPS